MVSKEIRTLESSDINVSKIEVWKISRTCSIDRLSFVQGSFMKNKSKKWEVEVSNGKTVV